MKGILFSKVNLLLITAVLITSSWIEEKITADHIFSQEMPNKNNVLVIKAEHAYQNIEIQTSDTILVKPSIRYRKGIKSVFVKNNNLRDKGDEAQFSKVNYI